MLVLYPRKYCLVLKIIKKNVLERLRLMILSLNIFENLSKEKSKQNKQLQTIIGQERT